MSTITSIALPLLSLLLATPFAGPLSLLCQAGNETADHHPGETVTTVFPSGERLVPVRVYLPETNGPYATVILLHGRAGIEFYDERFGLLSARLVSEGFAVIVPLQLDNDEPDNPVVDELRFSQWVDTIGDTVRFARGMPRLNKNNVGLAGFSLGAFAATVWAATEGADVQAVAVNSAGYSRWLQANLAGFPPTLIVHADSDPVVDISSAHQLEERLRDARVRVELVTYETESHILEGSEWLASTEAMAAFFVEHLQP